MTEVYIASKLVHAPRWIELRESWAKYDIHINSRWIFQAQQEDFSTDHDFKIFWGVDQADVYSSDLVIVYGEDGEELRGALVEAGMALAYNKPIIIIGNSKSFGTWKHHSGVHFAGSLEHSLRMIINMSHPIGRLGNHVA